MKDKQIAFAVALNEFNFEQVLKVMTCLDWAVFSKGELSIPTIVQMKKTCTYLFNQVLASDISCAATEGFSVEVNDLHVKIVFTLCRTIVRLQE